MKKVNSIKKLTLSFVIGLVFATLAFSQDRVSRPDSTRSFSRHLGNRTVVTTSRVSSTRTVTGITRQIGSQRVTTWSDGARTTTRSVGRSRITEFKRK